MLITNILSSAPPHLGVLQVTASSASDVIHLCWSTSGCRIYKVHRAALIFASLHREYRRRPPPQGKTIRSAPVAGLDSRGFSPLWKPDFGESQGGAILARPQKWPFLLILRVKTPKMRVLRLHPVEVGVKPAIVRSSMLISLCNKLIR
jgi:hypothetical protein